MTKQFKFGDLVRWANNPGQFVYIEQGKINPGFAWIRSADDLPNLAAFDELKPITHPDTVRLDWLADRDQHIGNVQLPAECVACNLHSLRDAIDMAMRMDKENTGTQEKDA
jgi:hypothetical protein